MPRRADITLAAGIKRLPMRQPFTGSAHGHLSLLIIIFRPASGKGGRTSSRA
jgi:hypothetical protein